MIERRVGKYFKNVVVRSLALDARQNAKEMEPEASPLELKVQACLLWLSTASFPATSRITTPSQIQWSKDNNNDFPNARSLIGSGLVDIVGWLATVYINRHFPMTDIFAERLGTNVATHVGLDAINYGRQKIMKLHAPRRAVFNQKIAELVRCYGTTEIR